MDKDFLKYMPAYIKELYDPQLKRDRIARERLQHIALKLSTYAKAAVNIVQRQKEMDLTQTEKKALHYSNNPSNELIETLVSILIKAYEIDKTTRKLLFDSYRILCGNYPKLAQKIDRAMRKR